MDNSGAEQTPLVGREDDFTRACDDLRAQIRAVDIQLLEFERRVSQRSPMYGEDYGEVRANLRIVHRHLEDANMRLGKAIQYHNGGQSVYDPRTVTGPVPG